MNRRDLLKLGALATTATAQTPVRKGRFRTSICAYSFRDELKAGTIKYDDILHMASDLGVDGVEATVYWFPNNSDEFLLPLRRLAYRLGVDLYGIGIRSNMCRPTPELQKAEVANVTKWLDVAERLGARHVRVFGGPVPKGVPEQEYLPWAIETLKGCAEAAGKRGIVLGLEDDGGITESAEPVVHMVKQVDSPWLGINLDVGNFRYDAYKQVAMCVPYATNVHFKTEVMDGGKRVPADWDRLLQMFASTYRGYLSVEYEATGNARAVVPEMMTRLRRMVRGYEG